MKFIRDIIGEKRQMDKTVNSAPIVSVLTDEMIMNDPGIAEDVEQIDEPTLDTPVAENVDTAPEADLEKASDDKEDDIDHTDFSGIFSESTEIETDIDEPVVTDGSEPLNVDAEHADEPQEESTATPETAEQELSKEIDRALVSEHTPDESLERVFRAMSEMPGANQIPVGENDPELFEDVPEAPSVDAKDASDEPLHAASISEPVAPEPDTVSPVVEAEMTPPSVQAQPVEMPRPAVGRSASRHGRVKTRLLGFNTTMQTDADPIKDSDDANSAPYTKFPVGWLMVVAGEGRGSAFTLFDGVNNIGRGEDQTVRLNFGDNAISRENHASVAYDPRQQSFFIGHGGKANIVRRNDRPVLSTEEMEAGDQITIGETTLRFVPLCGPEFSWEEKQELGDTYAVHN